MRRRPTLLGHVLPLHQNGKLAPTTIHQNPASVKDTVYAGVSLSSEPKVVQVIITTGLGIAAPAHAEKFIWAAVAADHSGRGNVEPAHVLE
ncbi:hypothetical protein MRS44_008663 [Fusarium solani]|uniref:uncharacterized protein n=1 Tax=Fusarium solani TaxID=169388 RepID=UPI0032C4B06C|nr:hypothetical protein MRS44_008663 [Fusarium solani]